MKEAKTTPQPADLKSPFERFVAAILAVPKGEIEDGESKRLKRAHAKKP